MIDVPETPHHKPERGRLTAMDKCTDDGSRCTMLPFHEVNGSWTFHGLGAPEVRLTGDIAVGQAEWILARAR